MKVPDRLLLYAMGAVSVAAILALLYAINFRTYEPVKRSSWSTARIVLD